MGVEVGVKHKDVKQGLQLAAVGTQYELQYPVS